VEGNVRQRRVRLFLTLTLTLTLTPCCDCLIHCSRGVAAPEVEIVHYRGDAGGGRSHSHLCNRGGFYVPTQSLSGVSAC
jgi:hypothetical protein